jgi:hypothetical protein
MPGPGASAEAGGGGRPGSGTHVSHPAGEALAMKRLQGHRLLVELVG